MAKQLFGESLAYPWQGFCLQGHSFRPVASIRVRRAKRASRGFWRMPSGSVPVPWGRPGPGKPVLVALPVLQAEAWPGIGLSGRGFAVGGGGTTWGCLRYGFRLRLVRLTLCFAVASIGLAAGPSLGGCPGRPITASGLFYDPLSKTNEKGLKPQSHRKNMKKTLRKLSTLGLFLLGSLGLAGKANAALTFDGKVWRGTYGTGADSAVVTLYNPRGPPDTAMAKVSEFGSSGYWSRAPPWTLQAGDTVKIKTKDTNSDSAMTYRIVTSPNGGNLVVDQYPAGHSICVKSAQDGVDSVNAKCWVDGKLDTLYGRFRRNTSFYNISFNSENFPSRSKPNLNDLLKVEAWEGSVRGSTQGRFKREFWDADTLPSFNLVSGVYEEIDKHDKFVSDLRISPNPASRYFMFNKAINGTIYNSAGQKVGNVYGNKFNTEGLASDIYFIKYSEKGKESIKKVLVVR